MKTPARHRSRKRLSRSRRRRATAYHEAGHAVACVLTKRGLIKVSIIPTDDANGFAAKRLIDIEGHLVQPAPNSSYILDREVLISFCGQLAEDKFLGLKLSNLAGAKADNAFALEMGFRACGSTKEANAWLAEMYEDAKELVSTHWRSIEAVAEALLAEQELSSRRVKEIVRSRESLENNCSIADTIYRCGISQSEAFIF